MNIPINIAKIPIQITIANAVAPGQLKKIIPKTEFEINMLKITLEEE